MNISRYWKGLLATGAMSLALTACGGGGASQAASCLKYALDSGSGPGSCTQTSGGQTAEQTFSGGFGGPSAQSVTCVNKTGNEYSCTAIMTDNSQQSYAVTYDGKTIAY